MTDLFFVGSVNTQVGMIALLGDLGRDHATSSEWRSRCLRLRYDELCGLKLAYPHLDQLFTINIGLFGSFNV